MHYVDENHLAFDPASLGFPSILGCQAICLQTSRGLYGFHDYKSGTQGRLEDATPLDVSNDKLTLFARWIADHKDPNEVFVALYGVINRAQQYATTVSGVADWESVLMGLASALEFTGDVYGARLNSHLGTNDSAYVQFDLVGPSCAVGFKRWSKMSADIHNKVTPVVQQRVVSRGGTFVTENLYGRGQVAPVVRKVATKGFNLNKLSKSQFTKFQ